MIPLGDLSRFVLFLLGGPHAQSGVREDVTTSVQAGSLIPGVWSSVFAMQDVLGLGLYTRSSWWPGVFEETQRGRAAHCTGQRRAMQVMSKYGSVIKVEWTGMCSQRWQRLPEGTRGPGGHVKPPSASRTRPMP